MENIKKVELIDLKVGDSFREYKSLYNPLYTIRKIENGEIYVDSEVTGLCVIKLKTVYYENNKYQG